ncbi:rhodanese-like domain-containing protein [Desulfobotulus sp. H1]|uniref:Rhodanese-like domain-containing protein n=1 Tax=Desulfobotulus pelophilus TaxID=2823377 RepID=A0ABT3N736_9BACT|nr:rhodanese-like domain-containing protein [Desulfobotulus pelophilus]MCW7753254.1 rhodanese-like domain-containing protein [Desulfobotulus pelophilus]
MSRKRNAWRGYHRMGRELSVPLFWFLMAILILMPSLSCTQPSEDFWISQQSLRNLMEAEMPGVLLMDVREVAEFRRAHIPGSVNIPLSYLETHAGHVGKLLKAREDMETMVLICNTHNRSRRAREILQKEGIGWRIWVLEMGVTGYFTGKKASADLL